MSDERIKDFQRWGWAGIGGEINLKKIAADMENIEAGGGAAFVKQLVTALAEGDLQSDLSSGAKEAIKRSAGRMVKICDQHVQQVQKGGQ